MAIDRTQRLRTAGGAMAGGSAMDGDHGGWGASQPVLAVLAVAALVVALFGYLILRAGPETIAVLQPLLAALPSEQSVHGWIAPSVAAGALLAGGALAALGLAAFVKGVRTDPFRWLAPVLIAFSSVVMTRLGLERSMGPLPATLYGVLTALLLLGGGVLVQAQGLAVAWCGAVLLVLPLLGLVLDQAHYAHGLENLLAARDPNTLLALVVLCLTSVGVGLTAFIGRPGGSYERAVERPRAAGREREQLAMALERMRASEQRAAALEEHARGLQQALEEQASYGASMAEEEAAFAAAARPRNAQKWFIALGLVVIGASLGAVGLHMAMVKPLHAQVADERDAAGKALEARTAEISALRMELTGARARLEEQLAIEKGRAAAASAELKVAQEQLAAAAAEEAEVEEPAPKRAAKKRVRVTKRAAAKRKAPVAAAAQSSSGLRESVSDDPIGGLE